ncbi:RPN6, 26S proteasome regulatory complex component [Pyrenophora tritici-repentis]|nr:RPN6, 26S proteasome regulatory complex component [Pyrenophora tritici-repentis]
MASLRARVRMLRLAEDLLLKDDASSCRRLLNRLIISVGGFHEEESKEESEEEESEEEESEEEESEEEESEEEESEEEESEEEESEEKGREAKRTEGADSWDQC